MRTLNVCLFAFVALSCFIVSSPSYGRAIKFTIPIPILDKADVVEKESEEGPYTGIDIPFPSQLKDVSILKSIAKHVKCPEIELKSLNKDVAQKLESESIEQVLSLEPKMCAEIAYGKYTIEISYSNVNAKIKKEYQQRIKDYHLILITLKDVNKKTLETIAGLNVFGDIEDIRNYGIYIIADIDNDKEHEIVMREGGAEGGTLFYVKLVNGHLERKDLE